MRKIALTSLALAAGALVAGGSALGAASSTPKTFTVHMTGPQEVPKGSPTGTGTFRYQLNPSKGQVCYSLTWSKIGGTALASHIHKAAKGKSGTVVIPLSNVAPVKHSGCVKAAKSLILAIQAHPSRYYVNVHTAKYPGGAIRGQL
jgi:CHRD domain